MTADVVPSDGVSVAWTSRFPVTAGFQVHVAVMDGADPEVETARHPGILLPYIETHLAWDIDRNCY